MTTGFSRSTPSPRYQALLTQYRDMHENGAPGGATSARETFDGRSLYCELVRIDKLVKRHGVKTVLDYGCGKARLHIEGLKSEIDGEPGWVTTRDIWGTDDVALYDPGYAPYAALPDGPFDAVISTDVMEHVPEPDVPWVLDEIFSLARKLVFVNIASYPAMKNMPDGENAHCTVKPVAWWRERLAAVSAAHPDRRYVAVVDTTGQYRADDPFAGHIGERIIEG